MLVVKKIQLVPSLCLMFLYHLIAKRQRGRFAGFSLYASNTTDRHSGYLCYKDGPALPPLDFNTNCTTRGRYVIFYNERLPKTSYPIDYETSPAITELCEVTVTGIILMFATVLQKLYYNFHLRFCSFDFISVLYNRH